MVEETFKANFGEILGFRSEFSVFCSSNFVRQIFLRPSGAGCAPAGSDAGADAGDADYYGRRRGADCNDLIIYKCEN